MITYYILTDVINKDCVIRFDDAHGAFERYNVARASWDDDIEFLGEYLYEDSPFYDFYEEIAASEVQQHIDAYKARWAGYWSFASKLESQVYPKLNSPIKGQNYKEYCDWLADFAHNEKDRVLYGLSGLIHIKDWQTLAERMKLPSLLCEFMTAYQGTTVEIHRGTNKFIRSARQRELEMLLEHGCLVNADNIKNLYNLVSRTLTVDQIYAGMLD